jgi:Bacterial inner membrane protein.
MTIYLFAEVLALISAILYFYSVLQRKNKHLFAVNFTENLITIIKNIILGAWSGAIVQVFGSGILCLKLFKIKNKLVENILYYSIIIAQIATSAYFNNHQLLGWIPIIASAGYYLLIKFVEKNTTIKFLLVINLTLWIIYYLFLGDYVGALANTASVTFTLIVTIRQYFSENELNKSI